MHHRSTGHKVHCGRHEPVVIANANHVGIGHVCPHHRVLKSVFYLHYLLGKPSSNDAVAFGSVVQEVLCTRAVFRRHDVSRRNHLRQLVDNRIVCGTLSSYFLSHHFSCHEWHVSSLEVKVGEQVFIHLFHLLWPVLLSGVGFSLQHEYSLYHSVSLSNLGQFHKSGIRVVVIVLSHVFHP